MKLIELTEQEYERTHFDCESFLQDVRMYRRHKAIGREAYLVGLKKGEKILAKGLIMTHNWYLGKKLFRVPGGWILDYAVENWREVLKQMTEQAKVFCAEKGGIVIEISPNLVSRERDNENEIVPGGENHLAVHDELIDLGYKYLAEYECTKWTYALRVERKTAEELFKNFREGHRRIIKKAAKNGVRVRELSNGELGILDKIVASTAERRGFEVSNLQYYHTMKEAFGNKVQYMVAEVPQAVIDGEKYDAEKEYTDWVAIAAAMFVDSGEELVYLYGGSKPEYRQFGAPHAIQWEMIQQAVKKGYKRYDFYGVKPVSGSGVYVFKQGFRGYVQEMLGTFALPIGKLGKIYVAHLKKTEYSCIKGE